MVKKKEFGRFMSKGYQAMMDAIPEETARASLSVSVVPEGAGDYSCVLSEGK